MSQLQPSFRHHSIEAPQGSTALLFPRMPQFVEQGAANLQVVWQRISSYSRVRGGVGQKQLQCQLLQSRLLSPLAL
jgi:hypothetical protein